MTFAVLKSAEVFACAHLLLPAKGIEQLLAYEQGVFFVSVNATV